MKKKALMINHTHTHKVIKWMLEASIYEVHCKKLTFNPVLAAIQKALCMNVSTPFLFCVDLVLLIMASDKLQ